MTGHAGDPSEPVTLTLAGRDGRTGRRLARSALSTSDTAIAGEGFAAWFAGCGQRTYTQVDRVPLDTMDGWSTDPVTGNIGHRSGKFFTVVGLDVEVPDGPVRRWSQPTIVQPEIGILGILVCDIDGVLHCLMQAKVEPGNSNGVQLSPTVQATRSNYTGVHQGKAVPYLEYFRNAPPRQVLADVRQSEQGSWFHHKRNRNMVVEVPSPLPTLDGFRWMTLGDVHKLLATDNLVNMDARTVLSCLPFSGNDLTSVYGGSDDPFRWSLIRSASDDEGSLHHLDDLLSWITDFRTQTDVNTTKVPLNGLPHWHRDAYRISHDSGLFFDVIGVSVTARGREVGQWMQPMIAPHGTGLVAFLMRRIGGVLHVLVQARVEPGYVDVVELAPTVQCTPENYAALPSSARPRFLDEVLRAGADRVRFASVLSEEGGRFYHALNRYLLVQTDADPMVELPDFRWMTLHQLADLLRHSHYVNVQARSLIACLHSLFTGT
jgi:oxidase EvaA